MSVPHRARSSHRRQHRVCLHLDVNKTLIMQDPAANATLSEILNGILASNAFGSVHKDEGSGELSWTLSHPTLCVAPPSEGIVSYYTFAKELKFPYSKPSKEATPEQLAALRLHNTKQKDASRALITTFAEPGQPGKVFNGVLKALEAKMKIPDDQLKACHESAIEGLSGGNRFLLPAYFELLRYLTSRKEEEEKGRGGGGAEGSFDFLVIFRTFGVDSASVIEEHNAFVSATHPLYPPLAAASSSPLHLIVRCPDDTGAITRGGFHSRDTRLAVVVDGSHDTGKGKGKASAAAGGGGGMVRVLTGWRDIHDRLLQGFLSSASSASSSSSQVQRAALALQDDYTFWFSHAEKGVAGKLLPIAVSKGVAKRALAVAATDEASGCEDSKAWRAALADHAIDESEEPLQLFFDDNIGSEKDSIRLLKADDVQGLPIELPATGEDSHFASIASLRSQRGKGGEDEDADAGIVDCRDIHTGHSLPYAATKGIHLCRIDPLSAILNVRYFVELMDLCEANYRRAQREAEEAGTAEEEDAESGESKMKKSDGDA